VLKLGEPTKSRFPGFRDAPYKLVVINALKFIDVVAKIQRALAANFGVPIPSLA
jgi:hypothetical protein